MFGGIVLFLREKWTHFWCSHDCKYRDLPADCSRFYCTKCEKIKKKNL